MNQQQEKEWQSSFDEAQIFDGKGKLNAYVCEKCGHATITIDRVKGVTPYLLRCRALEGTEFQCNGTARSKLYRLAPGFHPTHEWYRPTLVELDALDEQMQEHVRSGGLLLRPIQSPAFNPVEFRVEKSQQKARFQGQAERNRRIRQQNGRKA